MDGASNSGWDAYNKLFENLVLELKEEISDLRKAQGKNKEEILQRLTTLEVGFKYQASRVAAIVSTIIWICGGIVLTLVRKYF